MSLPDSRRRLRLAVLGLALAGPVLPLSPSWAQTPPPPLSLQQAFQSAWERQPEARALAQRREAAQAGRDAAGAWTPEPAALEASLRSDRLNAREGARELEFGVAVPLWLPGERARSQALADAQTQLAEAQAGLAQWQLAEQLREAWWGLRAEQEELAAAQARLRAADQLAADVARRVKAGELSRADQHQADGAAAAALGEQALQQARRTTAEQGLRALIGLEPGAALQLGDGAEPEPQEGGVNAEHPLLRVLQARSLSARNAAALARVQSRGNPEITLLQTRDRAARGEASVTTLSLGLRFPLGRSDARRAAIATAGAEQTEAEVGLQREQERLQAAQLGARAQLDAARQLLNAADTRARLALETRDFFDKAFRFGETDLPTRLRVELEAANAQREQARARIGLQQAIAHLRQTLGLLPGQP